MIYEFEPVVEVLFYISGLPGYRCFAFYHHYALIVSMQINIQLFKLVRGNSPCLLFTS